MLRQSMNALQKSILHFFVIAGSAAIVTSSYADCTSPPGRETDIIYNSNYHTYQFCNGTSWVAYGGGSTQVSSGYSPTAPSGNGYFVLTSTTYDGNLGGRAGADSKCLTELATTNTGWMGYSTANSNGQLVANKVHGWVCDRITCNDLMPLTTYYFANAGDSLAGGASFTTDASGAGPGDTVNWSAANYFSGTFNYWTGRAAGTNTAWGSFTNHGDFNCTNFTDGVSWQGYFGVSASTTTTRWAPAAWVVCSNTYKLICFVNP
jgi:hypothetical protein